MASLAAIAAVLLAAALFTRLQFLFAAFYLIVALVVLSWLWVRRMQRGLRMRRRYQPRLFLGESTTVTIELSNLSVLPIPWVNVREGLPVQLATYEALRRVERIGPKGRATVEYELQGTRRGFHRLGPFNARVGDVFGVASAELSFEVEDFLIVYPEIVPFGRFELPSSTPFGEMRSRQQLYEDPIRVTGVRDYLPGDSQRLINWKASASAGRLLVRRLEPAVSHEAQILVDLNPRSYSREWRESASELAIVVAASAAAHLLESRQTVGLAANGLDPFRLGGRPGSRSVEARRRAGSRYPRLPMGRGRGHLMRVLDLLARVELIEGTAPGDLISTGSIGLPFGSTLLVVTGLRTEGLLAALVAQRKLGHRVVAVFTDPSAANLAAGAARAAGLTAFAITSKEQAGDWHQRRAAV